MKDERDREFDEKLKMSKRLEETFRQTIEHLHIIINRVPNKERKELLEIYQIILMISSELNYLNRYNLRKIHQINTRLDNLEYELNEKNGLQHQLEIPQNINETLEKFEEHESVIKWIKRKYEDETKNLEGNQQNE
jgi:hypothetical protein